MVLRKGAVAVRVHLAILAGSLAGAAAALAQPAPGPAPGTPPARLRWLAEPGSESFVHGAGAASPAPIVIAVPGAAYVFDRDASGGLRKLRRLAADSAAAYGVAVSEGGLALADRLGSLSLWATASEGEPSLRWRRELGDRVTSVGWDGGPLVLAATWKGRLEATSAADGRRLWSADLGGRAEAPAVVDGGSVFVATKAKTLLRIDAATGAARWRAALPGIVVHPPVVVGERPHLVVCATWDGQMLAFDVITGRPAWTLTLGARLAGPLAAGTGLVAAVTSDGVVGGYDLSGRPSWTAPGAALGPATLLWQNSSAGAAPRLLSVSKVLVSLDASTGRRLAAYPEGVKEQLRQRFADAMLDGVKTYSEAEKQAAREREAPELAGAPFGAARLVGPRLAFGTEEGWAYLFDASSLRPCARYHAGPPASALSRASDGRVLAAAGEEVYAFEPATGELAWKRTVGAEPSWTLAGDTLGVLAGGRVQAVATSDGSLGWTLRGGFRFATADSTGSAPWLVDDGEGRWRALVPPGRLVGEPLPIGGEPLAAAAAGPSAWVVATRQGTLRGVGWVDEAPSGRLEATWQRTFDEPLAGLEVAGGRVLVRAASGALVAFDPASQAEAWRLPASPEARVQPLPQAGALLLLGGDAIRVHDWSSGQTRAEQKVGSPALAAHLQGEVLVWIDRAGQVHRAGVTGAGERTRDLGLALVEAVPVEAGFLVRTAAGEVGFVEVAPVDAAGGDSGSTGFKREG